jgi:hypothetical protein
VVVTAATAAAAVSVRGRDDPPPALRAGRVAGHGVGEGLLRGAQTAGVAFSPYGELAVGRAGPQEVVGAFVLVPGAGGLAELVAELGGLGVLGLPAHQARPVGEQRLVDDLDAAGGLAVVLANFVRGEQPGVDQLRSTSCSRLTARG